MTPSQLPRTIATLRATVGAIDLTPQNPFDVLVATVISLRTKDEVTFPAARRLLDRAPTPAALAALDPAEVQRLIYPAGFSPTKAKQLVAMARTITHQHGGQVPNTLEGLTAFSGVGQKTANLVLGRGFGIPAICVDTHVHRIPNRWGLINTPTPEKTEAALRDVLPQKHWIEINELLVRFGQQLCTPRAPHCTTCPLTQMCKKKGVTRAR